MERTSKTDNPERDRELEGKARTLVDSLNTGLQNITSRPEWAEYFEERDGAVSNELVLRLSAFGTLFIVNFITPTLREAFEVRNVKKDKSWWKFWR